MAAVGLGFELRGARVIPQRPVRAAVRERFNAINLADCRLLGVAIEPTSDGGSDRVRLRLELVSGEDARGATPAILTFRGCAGAMLSVDLWVKKLASDSIADSRCDEVSDPDWLALDWPEAREAAQPFSELLQFTIDLCSPAGRITVLARDFDFAQRGG